MYLQKVISRKFFVKNLFFAGILKVNDENSRIRIQDPDPDPLVRSMDPRIRIRIHPKMSWIRNTGFRSAGSGSRRATRTHKIEKRDGSLCFED
jgi:hypothetical protein